MAFKGFTGLRRDYLAKEILIEFLQDPSVKHKIILNGDAHLDAPSEEESSSFMDILVSRCVGLSDKLIKELGDVSPHSDVQSSYSSPCTPWDDSPIVLDGDLS